MTVIMRVEGPDAGEQEASEPAPEAVRRAVHRLNGRDASEVYLTGTDGWWLGICGGPEDFFLTMSNEEIGEYWAATPSAAEVGDFEIVCGGQLSRFPAPHRASRTQALTAALYFVKTEGRDETLNWKRV